MADPSLLTLELDSVVPAYRQIADGLRALLVGRSFDVGEQLPTVRELAMDLGVHHNTVAEAYRTLASEGWLDLTRRRGATVLARATPITTKEEEASFVRRLEELVAQARGDGIGLEVIRNALNAVGRGLPRGSKG